LCNTGSFATSQGASLTGAAQLSHLEGYCEPNVNGEVGNFSLVGKKPIVGNEFFL